MIILLDDDPDQRALVEHWLDEAGLTIESCATASEFRRAVAAQLYDLYILDWELMDGDGLSVLRWLRQSLSVGAPVIFTTVRDGEEDIVAALEAGADDYLIKPLKRLETLARIRAALRRGGVVSEDTDTLEHADLKLSRHGRSVEFAGREIELSHKEFDLLWLLAKNIGSPVSREQALSEVWGYGGQITTRTVDTHISRLRRKMGLKGEPDWDIVSVYYHGYRLECRD